MRGALGLAALAIVLVLAADLALNKDATISGCINIGVGWDNAWR